jgi:hypothetical protein
VKVWVPFFRGERFNVAIKINENTCFDTEIEWFQKVKKFSLVCEKCGSKNVSVENNLAMGSSWTGMYGSCEIECQDCGEEEELYS